ncbi:MAG: C10 family peptidase [Planctomycetota bacterium]
MKRGNSHSKRSLITAIITIPLLFTFISSVLFANPVEKKHAQKAAQGWLKQNRNPMDCPISNLPTKVKSLFDEDEKTLCYIVNLEPAGFVIVSADDEIEPVIAFSSTGYYDGDENSPLTALLKEDMSSRLDAAKQGLDQKKRIRKSHKWKSLIEADVPAYSTPQDMVEMVAASVSQVRVDPFLQSEWDQGDVSGSTCYNYYTPSNYPTGCVATAMAQVMRYHTWPVTGIGVNSSTIYVNGSPQTAYTRGGNGSGGAYNWAQMPLIPLSGVTSTQREAIGALCYDAGVMVGMDYMSGGSSASLVDADQEMTATFNYTNSIYTQSFTSSGDDRLWNLLNANLDAQLPVILGVSGSAGGHAVIADGYGYTDNTLYHHLNMGWGGYDNAWYQLPLIDASYTFNAINDAVYNIYSSGTGEIISGRVTNLAGAPLENVSVSAYIGATLQKQTTTNSRGVYALQNLSSNTIYRISAVKSGENFLDQNVTTGNSADWGTPGNRSGILFVSATVGPPTAFDITVQDANALGTTSIQLQVLDDGEPDPNLLRCIITSLPSHGELSEPNVGPIDAVPYIMAVDSNSVDYTPCPYFGGQDTFTYKANDGGTYPIGGDSNIATVTVNVNNQLNTDFGTESDSYTTLMMDTGSFYDVRSEVIYLQSDIGGHRKITDLALNVYTAPGRTLNNWTIRMQHTNLFIFNSVTTQFLTSGWTTVYQGNENIQTGWINFHFDTPFEYNGIQNLLVDFSFNNSGRTSPSGVYLFQNVGANRVLSLTSSTGTHGDPLDWDFWALDGAYYLSGFVPSMKLIGEGLIDPLVGDFDATCDVRMPDLAIFSQAWQTSSGDANYDVQCDLTAVKGIVDIQDLIIMANQWLETYHP